MIENILFTLLSMTCVYAQSATDTKVEAWPAPTHQNITDQCFGCMCEASSNCNLVVGCNNGVCGPFSISWKYWSNAGEFTINDENPNKPSAYAHCANDILCATKTVQAYMNKHGQDCNGDGVINCDDYARIHHLSGYECSKSVTSKYLETYQLCMEHVNNSRFSPTIMNEIP